MDDNKNNQQQENERAVAPVIQIIMSDEESSISFSGNKGDLLYLLVEGFIQAPGLLELLQEAIEVYGGPGGEVVKRNIEAMQSNPKTEK